MLETLTAQVREHAVDVVVLAGDVFDSATPAARCYTLLTDTLAAILAEGAAIVVTSGNHDSAARLGFQSSFLGLAGIHVVTDPLTVGTPITIDDVHGPVHFYGIPFLEPTLVRHLWPDAGALRSQAATLSHAMGLVTDDLAARGGRSVAIAHCFAAGVEASPGLERDIQQGGLDVVPLSTFDGPDYVALGHIHGRSQLSERVRYAGAPLHYSFGEGDKPRGSWLVEMDAKGLSSVQWLALPVARRLSTLRGTLDELLHDERFAPFENDWVCAQLTDATPQTDPMRKLQARFAGCATIQPDPQGRPEADGLSYAARRRAAVTDADVIEAFLVHVRAGEGASPVEAELIDEVIAEHRVAEVMA